MRPLFYLVPILLAGCAGAYQPAPLSEKQAVRLEKALDGRVAGEKVNCISQSSRADLTVISDNVLLYRAGGIIYRNDLIGSCSGLTRGDTLITRSFGSQLCRGDIARTANLSIGFQTGTCALGDFTPYRRPR
ncbi:MAG: hypothetical protein ABW164_03005 [Sphingobium sp.]